MNCEDINNYNKGKEMRKLVLFLGLLAGCAGHKIEPTTCYKVNTCKVKLNGMAEVWPEFNGNSGSETWPEFNVVCAFGYDANGNENGEVQRFLTKDTLYIWSLSHPDAKACK